MLQSHLGDRFRYTVRFVTIQRTRLSLVHCTISTASSTDLSENHKSRYTMGPAFTHIGAHSLLADGVKTQASQQSFQLVDLATKRHPNFQPGRVPSRGRLAGSAIGHLLSKLADFTT